MQRPLKFVKYLPHFRWRPVVLTVDPVYAAYPDMDAKLAAEIPQSSVIYRTKSWDPYKVYASFRRKSKEEVVSIGFLSDDEPGWGEYIARFIRANVFIPDARVGWYPYALTEAKRIVEERNISAIVTSGPPHSTHLVGRSLKRKTGIPWIADFRDPWVDIDYVDRLPMSPLAHFINRRQEQSVLDNADVIVSISNEMKRVLSEKTSTPVVNIFNGFDESDFAALTRSTANDSFTISYVGNMNADRNPELFWRYLADRLNGGSLEKVKVKLIGNVDQRVLESIRESRLESVVEKMGYLPHDKAILEMMKSSLLLLVINRVPSATGIVTGKLFEYLASNIPILGIGPPDGDAADILKETESGEMIDYDDVDGIARFIERHYDSWLKTGMTNRSNDRLISKYSRKNQTRQLAQLLDDLV